MMRVTCFGCWAKLRENGGLVFSPPRSISSDEVSKVDKFHLCVDCFPVVLDFIMGEEAPNYYNGMPTLQDMKREWKKNSNIIREKF